MITMHDFFYAEYAYEIKRNHFKGWFSRAYYVVHYYYFKVHLLYYTMYVNLKTDALILRNALKKLL